MDRDLSCLATFGGVGEETVFEHETCLEFALHDCEEFCGARVGVRGVHGARVEEADGGGDALVYEDGEIVLVGEDEAAALAERICAGAVVED